MEVSGELKERLVELGFGVEEGDSLVLGPLEVAYLAKEGMLDAEVDEKVYESMEYKAYELLRNRGYIVRESKGALRIFKKGYRRGEDRSFAILLAVETLTPERLLEDWRRAKEMKKELVYCFERGGRVHFFTPVKRSFP